MSEDKGNEAAIDEDSSLDVINNITVDINKQLSVFSAITLSITNLFSTILTFSLLYYKLGSCVFEGLHGFAETITFNIVFFVLVIVRKRYSICYW